MAVSSALFSGCYRYRVKCGLTYDINCSDVAKSDCAKYCCQVEKVFVLSYYVCAFQSNDYMFMFRFKSKHYCVKSHVQIFLLSWVLEIIRFLLLA